MDKNKIFSAVKDYFKDQDSFQFLPGETKINVGFPCYDSKEVISALDSLLDLNISQGKKVRQFEKEYSDYLGMKYGVAVNSGSSANLLALTSLVMSGIVPKGSEVIVPAATFTTVISPILQAGLKPVFVDIEMETYNVSSSCIESAINENTGLIMVVHSLGNPANMNEIMTISEKFNIPVFEDCCEAHGSSINGKKAGSFGIISAWSFFVAHNMTTGEGGMVNTNDPKLHYILRSIREFGRLIDVDPSMERFGYSDDYLKDYDERYVFENIGYNVRMTDIAASLGIEQLKKLDYFNNKRAKIANNYCIGLDKHKNYLTMPNTPKGYFHSFYGFTILVNENAPFSRKDIITFLENKNIETRAFMGGNLSIQPAYRDLGLKVSGQLSITEKLTNNAFFIGCHPFLNDKAVNYVIESIDKFISEL
jgi:CDP-4-dehydro-6-deoxyglucose reductase, E1